VVGKTALGTGGVYLIGLVCSRFSTSDGSGLFMSTACLADCDVFVRVWWGAL